MTPLTLCPLRVYPCVTMRPDLDRGWGSDPGAGAPREDGEPTPTAPISGALGVHCAGAPFSFSRVSRQLAQSVRGPIALTLSYFRTAQFFLNFALSRFGTLCVLFVQITD